MLLFITRHLSLFHSGRRFPIQFFPCSRSVTSTRTWLIIMSGTIFALRLIADRIAANGKLHCIAIGMRTESDSLIGRGAAYSTGPCHLSFRFSATRVTAVKSIAATSKP